MNKVIVRIKSSSTRDSEIFYCKELKLFDFYQDYGMGMVAWENMVGYAAAYWTNSESQKLLETTLKNHTDIAKVIYVRLGNEGQKWVHC